MVRSAPLRSVSAPSGMMPVCAGYIRPPRLGLVRVYGSVGRLKHERRESAALDWRPDTRRDLSDAPPPSYIPFPGRTSELGIGHRVGVDPEPVDVDAADRALLGIETVRTHKEES